MIAQKTVMDFFNRVTSQNFAIAEPAKEKGGNNQFMQIMDMITSENNVNKAANSTRKLFEAAQKENTIRGRSMPDGIKKTENIAAGSEKTATKVTVDSTKTADVESKEIENKETSAKKIVENLAAVLELNPAELQILLNAMGINENDLSNEANASMISEKLAAFIGLDEEMEQELHSLIVSIVKQGADSREKLPNFNGISIEDVRKGLNIQGSLEVKNISKAVSAELCSKFKQKLLEISQRFEGEEDSGEVIGDEEIVIKGHDSKVSEGVLERFSENAGISSAEDSSKKKKDAVEDTESEDSIQTEKIELKDVSTLSDEAESLSVSTKADGSELQPNMVSMNSNPEKVIHEVSKPFVENVRSGNEIVRQVVEKAQVILDGDKSEMVLSLKPESLGKLSLKVVTENGIVMAKFIAENQQVKQVLESNMQFLKENLEKQGLNVQGFSVSVRQDSGDGKGHYSDGSDRKRNMSIKFQDVPGIMADPSGFIQTGSENTYLNWGTSTINLMA